MIMRSASSSVLTGTHFFNGDQAACEGAIAAGCRFIAGYPITPSTELIERFSQRAPEIGGVFIQMEDEIASSMCIQGAVWAGAKAMTVTSGPGFSLMQENIGYAAMTETPCVFVNVQRAGPSTGLPTLVAQADMMQVKYGSHGDYEVIAISPSSPQECFTLMIDAFNLAEQFRVPVMFMMDESVGHLTEKVIIPDPSQIKIFPRRWSKKSPMDYRPYEADVDLVPDMVKAGDNFRIHITGLTHDERGYPVITPEAQRKLIYRLKYKIHYNRKKIVKFEMDGMDDCDIAVISYGITSRIAMRAAELARERGVKVGLLRLQVVWPLIERRIKELSERVKAIIVPEINMGQVVLEIQRIAGCSCPVISIPNSGGKVHDPDEIFDAIMEADKSAVGK